MSKLKYDSFTLTLRQPYAAEIAALSLNQDSMLLICLIIFSFCYFCSIFVAPFPFFVCASFVETNIWTSISQIQFAFIFGCLVLLLSTFGVYKFCVCVCFSLFLLVFVWFFLFFFVGFQFVFFFFICVCVCVFLSLSAGFCWVLLHLLFWFQTMTKDKQCFSCNSGVLGGGDSAIPMLVRMFS